MKQSTLSLKDSVRKRAGNCCEKCGRKIVQRKNGMHNGSVHHRHMRRMGGKDHISNLVLLCLGCHKAVHACEYVAAREGWVAWVDPEMTPVRLARVGWVLLVPDGTVERLGEAEALRLLDYVNGHAMDMPKVLAPVC